LREEEEEEGWDRDRGAVDKKNGKRKVLGAAMSQCQNSGDRNLEIGISSVNSRPSQTSPNYFFPTSADKSAGPVVREAWANQQSELGAVSLAGVSTNPAFPKDPLGTFPNGVLSGHIVRLALVTR
jgi:hypothetical protein